LLAYTSRSKLKPFINVIFLVLSLVYALRVSPVVKDSTFFETFVVETVTPIQELISSSKGNLSDLFNHYVFIIGVSKENEKLKNSVDGLKNQIFVLQELRRENRRIKSLLKFGQEIKSTKVLAQVVGWDSSGRYNLLRINKGSNDAIKLRDTVVTSKGLVGHVYKTYKNYSDIITILDNRNRVDSLVVKTRSHGIIEGFTNNLCVMKYVTRTDPVNLKDRVITAGLGTIYPKGILIGEISKVKRESYGITQYIEIGPSVDFKRLEEVIILTKYKKTFNQTNELGSEE
jgi:rod shape-determining protein MreC